MSPALRRLCPFLAAATLTLVVASGAAAHDFWIIPDMFAFSGDSTLHINGRSGTAFPDGAAVQPTRVADARVIGASTMMKITEMSIEGTSLRLHQRPPVAGEYLVVVALTPRTTRSTPAALMRYLRAEGGASEAARLERDSVLVGPDSVVYTAASYATTIIQVGTGGPRAFSQTTGFPLEFVPLTDPAHLHVGDTLAIRMLGGGKAIANIGVDAKPSVDSASANGTTPAAAMSLQADRDGIIRLPLAKAGPWMLRSAYVSRRTGGGAREWDVSRATYVFSVGARH